jgi:tetratricopeptide (TPR) repeat protein
MSHVLALLLSLTLAQSDFAGLVATMDRAYLNEDLATIRTSRANLLRMLAGSVAKDQEPMVRYAIAYADWRMFFAPGVAANERNGMIDEAESQLQAALKQNEKFAEAHALLAAVWGAKISQSALRGITLGPRVGSTIGKANAIDPENPRIVLQEGIGALNTPSMFGGGADKAEKLLRRAIMLFEKEPADKAWPNWGRFDAHAWLGQTLVERGDYAGARAQYAAALKIAPGSQWVQAVLLPALEKAAKKKP